MTKFDNYRSVCIEGGDQIGKGDVTNYLLGKFERDNVKIFKLSFPMYSTPFGTIVRKTLEEGFPSIPEIRMIEDSKRGLEVKMMLLAINRLEALESILATFKNKKAYFLLDRSPYSHAVTISYGLGGLKCILNEGVDKLVNLMFNTEKLFIEKLGLSECVIHLMADYGKRGWVKERSDGDLYEVREVQKVVDDVYSKIADIVGFGWSRIYTKSKGVFRNREDIYKEVDGVLGSFKFEKSVKPKSEIHDILQVARDVYRMDISELDSYSEYFENIEIDDNERNRETYKLACEIGRYIANNCPSVTFNDPDVRDNIGEIIKMYPEVLALVESHLGGGFLNKFNDSLDE